MSFRPRFRVSNSAFNPRFNNKNFTSKPSHGHQAVAENDFTNYRTNILNMTASHSLTRDATYARNKSNQESLPCDQFYSNTFSSNQPVDDVHVPYPNSTNLYSGNLQHSGPLHPSFNTNRPNNQYSNQSIRQNFKGNPHQINSNKSYFSSDHRNTTPHIYPYAEQNASGPNNSSICDDFDRYQNQNNVCHETSRNNFCTNLNTSLPNFSVATESSCNVRRMFENNSIQAPAVINSQASMHVNHISSVMVPPPPVPNLSQIPPPPLPNLPQLSPSTIPNLSSMPPPQWEHKSFINVPPPAIGNNSSSFPPNNEENLLSEKELKIADFLAKFNVQEKPNENKITIPEYRSALKDAFSLINLLSEKRSKLVDLINSDNEWNSEMESIKNLQKQLSAMCSLVSSPNHLSNIRNKLKCIKKKRNQKKKTKLNKFSEKIKAEQNRKLLHQEIDKWLDDIKEKNLKLKREVEMKKEADFILLEVRRKIQEANRTIEKINVFEKLRNARQANAVQKGLHILPEHNEKFEKNVSILKETMLRQLADYEAEEKALKVMLENEQEGQLEEKVQWEIKRAKNKQQRRKNHINECLFGISEDPLPTDPLYLFHKYHTSANNSIENLVQIRHQWDSHIAEDGESIPQQWITPVAPSDSSWEKCLIAPKS